ncbi:MAG: Arm DNA-binding domain-containing protein [Marinifilaceae bacterium]
MKQAFSVLFFIKKGKQISSGKHHSIYGRITINGSSTEFATRVKCKNPDWDITAYKIKGKSKAAKRLNLSLDGIRT